jgi:hypothetical protein
VGRWFLREVDYRVCGLVVLVIVLFFVFWRRWQYRSWPSKDDCFKVVVSLLGIAGGLPVCAVFLLTKPPAIQDLSGLSLAAIGLLVPIVTLAYGLPRLRVLFFPKEAPRQPSINAEADRPDSPSVII